MAAIGAREVTTDYLSQSVNRMARMTRRIRLLRDAGLLGRSGFTKHITRATTLEDLREAYRLVHDAYVEQGYILPHPTGLRLRPFEALPDTATFIAKVDGEIIGVISLVLEAQGLGLPSEKVFESEIAELRNSKYSGPICEISNLAVKPEYRKTSVFYELIQPIFAQGFLWGCPWGFISICPKHAKFFRDVIQFDPWGDCRNYCEETEDEVVGMRMEAATIEQRFHATDELLGDDAFLHRDFFGDNPFTEKCREWEKTAGDTFRDPELLRTLFVEEGELLDRCKCHELDCIREAWGTRLFREVIDQPMPVNTCDEGTRFGGVVVRII